MLSDQASSTDNPLGADSCPIDVELPACKPAGDLPPATACWSVAGTAIAVPSRLVKKTEFVCMVWCLIAAFSVSY